MQERRIELWSKIDILTTGLRRNTKEVALAGVVGAGLSQIDNGVVRELGKDLCAASCTFLLYSWVREFLFGGAVNQSPKDEDEAVEGEVQKQSSVDLA